MGGGGNIKKRMKRVASKPVLRERKKKKKRKGIRFVNLFRMSKMGRERGQFGYSAPVEEGEIKKEGRDRRLFLSSTRREMRFGEKERKRRLALISSRC